MTSFAEVSSLCGRELDARIVLARQLEHPALAALLAERTRRAQHKLSGDTQDIPRTTLYPTD